MTPAVRAAEAAGIRYAVLEIEQDSGDYTATRAIAALGVPPESMLKTLIAKLDGRRLVVALVPVCRELDLKALAGLAGARRAAMASPEEAERSTGYAPGALSPLGQRKRRPMYIDASAALLPKVYVSAGRRGLELELAPMDLIAACGARVGDLAR